MEIVGKISMKCINCEHCGEEIHQNTFDGGWRHWDGYRKCSDSDKLAEPATPDNVEIGGHND